MKNYYASVVRKDPSDTWNEELGKSIAKNRVLEKYYKDRSRVLYNFSMQEIDLWTSINRKIDLSYI